MSLEITFYVLWYITIKNQLMLPRWMQKKWQAVSYHWSREHHLGDIFFPNYTLSSTTSAVLNQNFLVWVLGAHIPANSDAFCIPTHSWKQWFKYCVSIRWTGWYDTNSEISQPLITYQVRKLLAAFCFCLHSCLLFKNSTRLRAWCSWIYLRLTGCSL